MAGRVLLRSFALRSLKGGGDDVTCLSRLATSLFTSSSSSSVSVSSSCRYSTVEAETLAHAGSPSSRGESGLSSRPRKKREKGTERRRDEYEIYQEAELSSQLDKAVKNVRNLMRRRKGTTHEIVEVSKEGELSRYTCTDLEVLKKVKDKSFQFRDLGLLPVEGGARRQAEVLVRDRSIVLRLFEVQAIIQSDNCMFFGANRPHVELAGQILRRQTRGYKEWKAKSESAENIEDMESGESLGSSGQESIQRGKSFSTEFIYERKRSADTLKLLNSNEDLDAMDNDSFEQKALQIALTSSISRLNHQAGQTGMLVDIILRDIGNDVESLRKVLPLKQKVEALRSDIESMIFVLTETLAQDEDMANMNLTWIDENQGRRPSVKDHLEVEAILETSRREVQQIGRILVEINERIDDTREVLNISLDSQRNRILTLNLQTSLLTLSLTAIAVPAGILGMNIPLGLEEDPNAFATVIRAMGLVGLCMYIIPVSYLYYGFFRTSRNRVKEVVALQNLVHDMDVVERTFYKMASRGEISKKEFQKAMEDATGRLISDEEMELICKAFDADGDDQLQLETYRRIIEHAIASKKRPL